MHLAFGVMPTDIPWIHLQKRSIAMVHLHLRLSSHEILPNLVLADPVPVDIAHPQTKMDDVG